MLKITKRVEYALIAIRHLQENQDVLVSVSDISAAYGIPKEILAKTLQKLASSNIVKSYKGPTGGYKATKKIAKTTLNDFFEILEGPTAIMDCYFQDGCDHLNSCNIRTPINKINDSIRNLFNNLTLADISQ
ncbi:MAG: Rrf2 family transcriptional regulator [Flavobacteriaceae bacterium]|jgi:Rrf2 family protein|nr:Rrf2 family transcriptional regulator [Flavobacteriaceae bacterium]MDC0881912.1 Rrf2 family transcriptional regulator [Candidatus Neomarinimicrobiota bacterium]MDG1223999.1 Rrf2 family transcriptional regulator [Candidatus Neomarinimicrobiota bacterium]MDG1848103.1 Rrf2 family transcriptional regulator [Candidatus Neomarinimicrobiota bacterium]|tara:strand:- start:7341 stop:7736 length:396 start_codon:yes stop_codon:yes gene_type:complete